MFLVKTIIADSRVYNANRQSSLDSHTHRLFVCKIQGVGVADIFS